jgi:uncharacterized protein (DUF736 family)
METKSTFPKSNGALWKKQSKSGSVYLAGSIEINEVKYPIMVFTNKKEKDNQPDYKIYPQTPRENKEEINVEDELKNMKF